MPITPTPARCPDCEEPLRVEYPMFRRARMGMSARAVFLGAIILSVVLLLTSFFVVGDLASQWAARLNLRPSWGVRLLIVTFLATIPIALLPVWIGGRYAFSRPRRAIVVCSMCRWSGPVLMAVKGVALPIAHPVTEVERGEFEGMGYIADPQDARRARQQRRQDREKRQAREKEHESPPNPDLDFS